MNNKLIPLQNSSQLLHEYRLAVSNLKAGLLHLKIAKDITTRIFGDCNNTILPNDFRDSQLTYSSEEKLLEFCKVPIKKSFWKVVVEKTEIKNILSIKKQEELDKSLWEHPETLPEPTEEALFDFINNNFSKAHEYAQEAIIEVFNFLRPGKSQWSNNYKTNQLETIGECVKREGVITVGTFGRINSHYQAALTAMDSLFHTLDGKRPSEYPNTLTCIIDKGIQDRNSEIETEYFRVKWFKKGSIHIYFKRADLVEKINQLAGKSFLKGENNVS